jgi:hypothetical protein
VSGNLRGLGNPEGIPFAFEATTPISAPWASILSQSSSKWGSPTAVYRIDRDVETPGPSERWRATTAATHRRYLGDAASVLRLGDHSGPTDYAVFQGGDTLIRISRTNTNVRAIYMNRSFAGTPLSF